MANTNNTLTPEAADTNAPSFLNYSRGFETGASASGQALGSVGDTVGKAIQLGDRYNIESVNNEVRQAVETLDTRYIGTTLNPSNQPLPAAAAQQIKNLERMKAAAGQGKISPEHYYSVLQARAKEIRSKYGDDAYAAEIDKAFTSLLGTTPAEAMRKIVTHAAQQAQANAQHETRHNREFLDSVTKGGLTMRADLLLRAAVPGAENDPKFMAEMRLAVGQDQAYKQQTAQKIQLLNLKKLDGESVADEDAKLLNGHALRSLQGVMSAAPEYKTLLQLSARVRDDKLNGRVTDPQVEDNIRVLVNALHARGQVLKDEITAMASSMRNVSAKSLKDAHDFVDNFVNSSTGHIANKNYELVGLNAATLQSQKDATTASMFQTNDAIRKFAAISGALGPQIWGVIQNSDQGPVLTDAIRRAFETSQIHDITLNQSKTLTESFSRGDAKSNTANLQQVAGILTSPVTPTEPTVFSNLASKIFSKEGQSFIARIGEDGVRNEFFLKLSSPQAFKNIQSVAELGRPEIMTQYKSFVANGLNLYMRKAVDEAVNYNQSLHDTRVKYNPTTQQFEIQSKSNTGQTPIVQGAATARDLLAISDVQTTVDNLNNALFVAKNFSKMTKEDVGRYIQPSINQIGTTADLQTNSQEVADQKIAIGERWQPMMQKLLQTPQFVKAVKEMDAAKAAQEIENFVGVPVR